MRQRNSIHEDLEKGGQVNGVDQDNDSEDSISKRAISPSTKRLDALVRTWFANTLGPMYLAALLTYSYHNASGTQANVQIAIMSVIVAGGAATMWCDSHLGTVAMGAFVGGHNIIGARGLDSIGLARSPGFEEYFWLLLLTFVVACLWCFVVTPLRWIDGYAGRLGTTVFMGMNLVQLVVWGPVGIVDWDRYYFGFVHVVHVAEESDAPQNVFDAWIWTQEAELAVGYILAVLWLATVAGGTRIYHARYVQRWHMMYGNEKSENETSSLLNPPKTLNNILVPSLWALLSIFLVNMTEYSHAPGVFNGFACGSYVAMASLQKIPSVIRFASVALLAAAWGLVLTPFFVGFAGKAGFTAMMGHVTYRKLVEPLFSSRKATTEMGQTEEISLHPSVSPASPSPSQSAMAPPVPSTHETDCLPSNKVLSQSDNSIDQESYQPQYTIRKPVSKTKDTFLTKQQRRQIQRLQHMEKQRRKEEQDRGSPTSNPALEEQHPKTPILHHRAWSLVPVQEGDSWQHINLLERLPSNGDERRIDSAISSSARFY